MLRTSNCFVTSDWFLRSLLILSRDPGLIFNNFIRHHFKRNEKFTFLLISRLITDKGVLEYIDAVKKLKAEGVDARFQILGAKDPEHKRGIKQKVIEGVDQVRHH
jgi:glycosyltransferase involved in cell wall biosynthesis